MGPYSYDLSILCPYKTGRFGHRDRRAQREDEVRDTGRRHTSTSQAVGEEAGTEPSGRSSEGAWPANLLILDV